MTTVKKTSAMAEKEFKQDVFSEELTDLMSLDTPSSKNAENTTIQRSAVPSVKEVEAKVAHMASRPGLRSKIDANCMWCSYDPLDIGNWRQQVEGCNVTNCPLYSVRPTSRGKK